MYDRKIEFATLSGLVLTDVRGAKDGSDEVIFAVSDGREFVLMHDQDCCENVSLADVCGDVADLLGTPIVLAEEATSDQWPEDREPPGYVDSFTWTFCKLATNKGTVTFRWLGESNGYYSESVSLYNMSADKGATVSATELEAKRWQAAIDAVNGKNELLVSLLHQDGVTTVTLRVGRVTEESLETWQSIGGGHHGAQIAISCKTSEWVEMLAQGVG